MTTIKSYTDFSQSEKLAEILPLESADLTWVSNGLGKPFVRIMPVKGHPEELCPCWSLAALLTIINKDFYPNIFHDGVTWNLEVVHHDNNAIKYDTYSNDVIDGVFEIILKLHEQNLL